jgi:hypothetical protein
VRGSGLYQDATKILQMEFIGNLIIFFHGRICLILIIGQLVLTTIFLPILKSENTSTVANDILAISPAL